MSEYDSIYSLCEVNTGRCMTLGEGIVALMQSVKQQKLSTQIVNNCFYLAKQTVVVLIRRVIRDRDSVNI